MDIGRFKASRIRLLLWLVFPPVIAVGIGLGSHMLQLQSQWKLNRIKNLADTLPLLIVSQQTAQDLILGFQASQGEDIQSEDQMISFVQEAARKSNFTMDELKVERKKTAQGMPAFIARVSGTGDLLAIEQLMSEVSSSHKLFSERSLKLSQIKTQAQTGDSFKAEIIFELILFRSKVAGVTGAAK